MVSDYWIIQMFYCIILAPLPVTNLMLRRSDFSDENAKDNLTVDIIVTWNEVRMLYIYTVL